MKKSFLFMFFTLLFGLAAHAQDEDENESTENESTETEESLAEEAPTDNSSGPAVDKSGPKTMSGMSILGNEETPKSLVIVPWKSSEMGDELDLSDTLDERARPVDKEVFLREVNFYQIRSAGQ
jgi:hypothetical protein